MNRALVFGASTAAAGILLALAAGSSAAPLGAASSKPLKVGGGTGNLVAPGDRVRIGYSVYSGSKAVRGTLFVRTNLQTRFARLPLTRGGSYQVRVPGRLLRGSKLFYYAVFRDPRSGRSLSLPTAGARRPRVAWILGHPQVVRLGTHRFGDTRGPEAVVARAPASAVGWRDPGPGEGLKAGPQTFLVGRDGSVWLDDEIDNRLLVWQSGSPETVTRTVPLPLGSDRSEIAFGPAGSLYLTRIVGVGTATHIVLDHLTGTGARIWESALGGYYSPDAGSFQIGSNTLLRRGPDGTLYCLAFMGLFGADEWAWMPATTPAGRPLAPAAQRHGTHWPFQPAAGGLRLVGPEVYTSQDDGPPHELRYALIDSRDRVVRAWRILSRTEINLHQTVPDFAGGDPTVVLAFYRADGSREYEVLRLGAHGARDRFSLSSRLWGDTSLPDLRVGPDGRLYQLATSPDSGVVVSRFALR